MNGAARAPAQDGGVPRTLRVLHVGPGRGQRGGIASVLAELGTQRARFADASIALSFFETRGFKSIAALGAFVFADLPRYVFDALRHADIVHFHVSVRGSFYRKLVLWALAKLRGRKTVFHLHAGNFEPFATQAGPLTRRAIAWFVRGCDAAVAVSSPIAGEMRRLGADRRTLHVIGNSARDAQAASDACSAQREAHGDAASGYVAFAGRLTEQKGIDDLLSAVALLADDGYCVPVRFAGGGDIARWERLARDYRIDDRVQFVGWLDGDAKLAFYRNARVFCMPSHYESFGIATLEAMFSRVPVVGTRVGGFLDLIEDGVSGFLVEPSDPHALALRLRLLMSDAQSARSMGEAAFARARQRYSCEAIVERYIHCYRSVIAHAHVRARRGDVR
ncbi:glycosyltransferase family 4 protein [Paraburkholderia solisilvae]|uniref:D-inositol-3-phosphate glycosyltransferase n=1 Tax=Paraburkholderia solisilvae TaxID=624376 RepID=A0A6J5E590_9BURK|nr:glycosyltransferase family 4 protein [Paraburkholderia solisilvae]CAB3760255.1 D-inositol-3-phosphate glycosyltransferase [Paraburkholderia solisilvae]